MPVGGYPCFHGGSDVKIEEHLANIAACETQGDLEAKLQGVAENLGFASFCFVDGSTTHALEPYHIDTDKAWSREYRRQGFVDVDPVLTKARRINVPFTWQSIDLPEQRAQVRPGAIRTMEAARDYGFTEGLVVPFHHADDLGRVRSMMCSFFWRDAPDDLARVLDDTSLQLHVYLIYWMQRSLELRRRAGEGYNVVSLDEARKRTYLTDRERDVMSWAARGKTANETAGILGITRQTVEEHVRSACRRLGAGNKTQGVAKAIALSAIDV